MSGDIRDPVEGRTSLLGANDVEGDSVRGFEVDVVEGLDSGKHWESLNERCTIGAHPSCDLVVEDPTVSRFHCEIVIGERQTLGSYTFTAEAIIAFARKFDPQPFHLSAEEGAKTHFGGLVASGEDTLHVSLVSSALLGASGSDRLKL